MMWNSFSPLCQSLMPIVLPSRLIARRAWLPDCSGAKLSRHKSLRKRNGHECQLQHGQRWKKSDALMAGTRPVCSSSVCHFRAFPLLVQMLPIFQDSAYISRELFLTFLVYMTFLLHLPPMQFLNLCHSFWHSDVWHLILLFMCCMYTPMY